MRIAKILFLTAVSNSISQINIKNLNSSFKWDSDYAKDFTSFWKQEITLFNPHGCINYFLFINQKLMI